MNAMIRSGQGGPGSRGFSWYEPDSPYVVAFKGGQMALEMNEDKVAVRAFVGTMGGQAGPAVPGPWPWF